MTTARADQYGTWEITARGWEQLALIDAADLLATLDLTALFDLPEMEAHQ